MGSNPTLTAMYGHLRQALHSQLPIGMWWHVRCLVTRGLQVRIYLKPLHSNLGQVAQCSSIIVQCECDGHHVSATVKFDSAGQFVSGAQ